MKPISFVLGFGLIAILGVACQQPTVNRQTRELPMAGALPQVCQAKGITSSSDFVSERAFFLPATYDPRAGGTPPLGANVNGQYATDLAAAFDAAPPSLKAMLCDKDFNVLIVQNTCPQSGCTADAVIKNTWGFRQQTASPKRYIATSAMLWQNGSVPTFSAYENVRLPAVLQRADANAKNWPNPPNFPAASTSPDMPVMTLLAVLAHEAGHVLWYDAFVSPPGGPFSASNFCSGNFYQPGSWSSINIPHVNDRPGRWIDFAESFSSETHNPDHLRMIKNDLSQSNFPGAGNRLLAVFQDPGLAGALAAFSPDEDFVEAYEWYVLTNASSPLTGLTIQISGHQGYDIPPGLSGPGKGPLRAKMDCLRKYIQVQPWPVP